MKQPSRDGSALILIISILVVSLAVASFVINIAYMELVRTELQVTTDLATRAACSDLVYTHSTQSAIAKAREAAASNTVGKLVLQIDDDDLVFQTATRSFTDEIYNYSSSGLSPNSVAFKADYFKDSLEKIDPLFPTLGVQVPIAPVKQATAVQAELDLVVVLDCSSSMLASPEQKTGIELPINVPLFTPPMTSRWFMARNGLSALLNGCRATSHEEQVGLVMYGLAAISVVPLTNRYEQIDLATGLGGTAYIGGLTNPGDAILSGLGMLSEKMNARPWTSRAILLVSDGLANFGPSPVLAAQKAFGEGVAVHTISISDEANIPLMQKIAEAAEGDHFHIRSAAEFARVHESITDSLPILLTK